MLALCYNVKLQLHHIASTLLINVSHAIQGFTEEFSEGDQGSVGGEGRDGLWLECADF